MFKNYFKIALRNLWKNKGFSAINIIGLAVGLATCLLIVFYVGDELSYDRYNKNADRIYRVDGDIQFAGNHFILAVAPDPVGPTLKREFPQIERFVRFRYNGGFLVKKGNSNLQENRVINADSTLFDVFTLPMIEGDPNTALVDPNSLVINERTAKKYFNTTNVVGRNLIINDTSNYKITGVIKNIPSQSHFDYDFFISMASLPESRKNNWVSNNFNTYFLLKKGSDPKKLEAQMGVVIMKYLGEQAKTILNIDLDEFIKSGNHATYSLMPLTKIHLHSNKTAELGMNGNIQYVYIFSLIAFLILLIACVNFMNLSTARSSNRAKEVGVRKVLGSLRTDLIAQFLTESVITCFMALLLALVLVWAALPYFNELSGKNLSSSVFTNPWLFPLLILLMLVVGIIAGSYPAFYLSAFKPIAVLKGKLANGFRSSWLRSGLVVFQFFISIVLIVGTIVIYTQLKYIHNKNVGFNRDQVLVIKNTDPLGSQVKAFKNEILKLSGVNNATVTGFLPTSGWRTDTPLFPDATLDQKSAVSMQVWNVDENYIPTLGMKIVEGRNFSDQFPTDSSGIILNQAAVKLLGLKDPLNKTLYFMEDVNDFINNKRDVSTCHIVGVVSDFNFNSLREVVSPLALFMKKQNSSIAFKISTENISGLISQINDKWKEMAPGQPFNYSFMDEDFNRVYNNDQKVGRIFISFALFAILIACLGLFGLVTYAAQQRTKEIGIRKVLGASEVNVAGMLSKDFLKLILVAALIAFPVSWWAMNQWLNQFAYRISISWWIFLVAGVTALLIGMITVSFQAIKAAIANPVNSLRSE
jgi:putative ABC transport system permease protein